MIVLGAKDNIYCLDESGLANLQLEDPDLLLVTFKGIILMDKPPRWKSNFSFHEEFWKRRRNRVGNLKELTALKWVAIEMFLHLASLDPNKRHI